MDEATQQKIDSMGYEALFRLWRFAPLGDPMFQGETGEYFAKRFEEKRKLVGPEIHTATSKKIGWVKGNG